MASLFLNYDPSGNPSGAFTGDGREVVFRNNASFVIPNAADNGFITPIALSRGAATEGVPRFKQGLLFGTDTANANILDDYEEGTWTPTQPTIGTNSASGTYTKIGRYVYASIFMTLPTNTSGVAFYIDSLPFTSLNNSGTNIHGGYSIYSTYGSPFTVRVHDNATRAQVSAIGGNNITLNGLDNINFRLQIHYMTN